MELEKKQFSLCGKELNLRTCKKYIAVRFDMEYIIHE